MLEPVESGSQRQREDQYGMASRTGEGPDFTSSTMRIKVWLFASHIINVCAKVNIPTLISSQTVCSTPRMYPTHSTKLKVSLPATRPQNPRDQQEKEPSQLLKRGYTRIRMKNVDR